MLHEVANYRVKGTRPRGRSRITWLKSMDNQLNEKGSSMKDVMSRICTRTEVHGEHSLSTERNLYSYLEIG